MKSQNHRLLEYSLRILELVASRYDNPISFKQICDKINLSKSTIYNLVQTLVNLDYLAKDKHTGNFTIGLKCFEVGNTYLSSNPFYAMAKDIIKDTSKKCNETTHFAILNGRDVVYLYKFESTYPIRVSSSVGKRVPAHATAIGKALLSGYDDKEIRELYPEPILPALTPNTITSIDVLLGQLREIRRTNIAYEKEESSPYIQCWAVPILNKQDFPVAGLSISVPIYRKESDAKKIVDILMDAKEQLTNILRMFE